MDFISILSIFVMACFVGYYVVWSVTPALHTPLMAVTNAISSVIIVGALIASAAGGSPTAKWLGLIAVALASVDAKRITVQDTASNPTKSYTLQSAGSTAFVAGSVYKVIIAPLQGVQKEFKPAFDKNDMRSWLVFDAALEHVGGANAWTTGQSIV
jgi:NAD(P) transhydrogenase subunit alpha